MSLTNHSWELIIHKLRAVSVRPFVDRGPTATSIRRNNISPFFLVAVLFCLIFGPALYGLYFLFGHQMIASMYTGDSSSILNHLVQRRQALPLSFYTDLMDKNAHKFLFLPLLTMLFYFAAYKACVYFSVSKEAPVVSPLAESGRVIKCDLIIAALAYSFLTLVYFAPGLRSISTSLIGPPRRQYEIPLEYLVGAKSHHR
jgi:hypothetical protein